jgi:integrase
MDQRVFTDSYIRALKPAKAAYKRSEYSPRGKGRLTVRVLPGGIKEFFYRYRASGLDRTVALGRYNPMGRNGRTLAEIRTAADKYRKLQADTGDVKEHLRAERRKRDLQARQGSLKQLCQAYVESLRAAGKPSAAQAAGAFDRYIDRPFPALAEAKASEIEPGDVQRILARMVREGITRQVNVLRSYLHAAFRFGGKADHDPRTVAHGGVLFGLKGNPVALVPRIAEYERVGERVLAEDELREFWKALDALPVTQRQFLRFNLALGGQRATQLLRADWPAFDFKAGTLLLRDTKGRGGARDHLVPLTPFALEQLKPLRELNGTAPSPFTGDGKRTMVLETLSVAVREISASLKKKQKIPTFQLRDLRRTCETMLAEMGVSRQIRAQVLSHGRASGVQAKHYDRYSYLTEKRDALDRWAERLQGILDPKRKARTVVPLRKRPSVG